MSNATYVAYIDESGDEGFGFGSGSSQWFVLSAVMYRTQDELNQVKVVDNVRDRLNSFKQPKHVKSSKQPLHFRDLDHEPRKLYISEISQTKCRTFTVMVHKGSLKNPEKFSSGSKLYFYSVRLLVERMSVLCESENKRAPIKHGDGCLDLVFSNRSSMSYADLKNYLNYLSSYSDRFGYKASPEIIRPDEIQTFTPGRRMGLQIADAVAGAYYFAVEPSQYGQFTEPSYAQLIFNRSYSYKGVVWNYGVKLFPSEADDMRKNNLIFRGWKK